ncbi:hypothetical protein ACHAXS_008085 [Conticribra weissflogii]
MLEPPSLTYQAAATATILLTSYFPSTVLSQHREGSPQYEQTLSRGEAALKQLLQSHPDVADDYYPNREAAKVYEHYKVDFPPIEDFVIGILVNPCGANGTYGRDDDVALGYDCCMGRFGQGEYAFRPGTRNQFSDGYSNGIPLGPDESLHNIDLVDEYGNELEYQYSRRADDVIYIDESCVSLREPHMACIADRFAAAKSPLFPPCWDHNQTVDATLDCYTPKGKRRKHCMQVSYSQNAYVTVCGGEYAHSDNCGTFLEIHKGNGSPYDDESVTLSDVKITTPVTNGMLTTTLPVTYKGDEKRILCSYEEINIKVGSMVRVTSVAKSCCCPRWLSQMTTSKIGAYLCPKRKWSKDGGPFAPSYRTLNEEYADYAFQESFPLCPALDENEDIIMCTQERGYADDLPLDHDGRFLVRPCEPMVEGDNGTFSSEDLSGEYPGICPIDDTFKVCGMTSAPFEECHDKDRHFTFEGEIGKVVKLPDVKNNMYGVTFNDGRTVYWFEKEELEFLKPPSNYEVWFVQRNRFEKTVQKKKPFKVIWPRCTFDSVNGRYFPYAQLNEDGNPIAVI